MKKYVSALVALTLTAASMTMLPATAAGELLHSGFESGAEGWTSRGTATVTQSTASASSGSGCLSVTDRAENWAGAGISLDTATFKPGETYSFSAMVSQSASPMAVHFKLSLEYTSGSEGNNNGGFPGMGMGGQKIYDCIAEKDGASGMWTELSNASYTIPAGASNMILYVETEDSKIDFLLDEVYVMPQGGSVTHEDPPTGLVAGDLNSDRKVNSKDADAMVKFLRSNDGDFSQAVADLNKDRKVNAIDLTLLKRLILNPPAETTQPVQQTTAPETAQNNPTVTTSSEPNNSGSHANPKEYMAQVSASMTQNVPGNVKQGDQGKTEHFTYMSKKAGHNKGANVWLPPGYDSSKKYNVLYMNHGVMGNEDSMLTGFSVREMASNMISSGEAEPFIIIFPQMYTDPGSESPGFNFNMDMMDHYDDFVFDLTDSLMPYVEEHWSVMTGKDHTAIAGFSMGGRESLYVGLMHPEMFGYVCASSPAPGIVPASDSFIANHLGSWNLAHTARLTNADFKIAESQLPYLIMIAGGTADSVVGTFPKEYHQLFDQNGTPHIWTEVPGGGHDGGVGTPLFYNFFKALFKA